MKKIETILKNSLEKRTDIVSWVLIFLSIIFLRSFVEQFLAVTKPLSLLETLMEFTHNLYFFSLTTLLLWILFSLILKIKPQKLSYIFIFSLFLAIAPSFIDMIKNKGQIYWSFYLLSSPADLWQQFITVFGHLPSGIVYFGTKITFIFAILIATAFVWFITKNFWKTFVGALGTYSILFFMGSFPSLFFYGYTLLSKKGGLSEIKSFNIAGFFGSPEKIFGVFFPSFQYTLAYKLNFVYFILLLVFLIVLFWLISHEKFLAVLKNLRLPQMVYHSGIFFIGTGLGILLYPQNFKLSIFSVLATAILLISVWLSWIASVIFNDIYDFEIDKITNPDRPLPKNIFSVKEYAQLGILFFALAILGATSVGLVFAVLLIVYQILAWFYSCPPFRLKKFPGIATFISSLASLMVLFLGFVLLSSDQTIYSLSWRITLLMLISYTISLPIKDFKDIEGDKKYGVFTIPVIFGEKKGRLIVAIGIFISFMLSVFFLNEFKLFSWALIFGVISFLTITNEKIKPRRLPAWVLVIVSVYTLILAWVVFV